MIQQVKFNPSAFSARSGFTKEASSNTDLASMINYAKFSSADLAANGFDKDAGIGSVVGTLRSAIQRNVGKLGKAGKVLNTNVTDVGKGVKKKVGDLRGKLKPKKPVIGTASDAVVDSGVSSGKSSVPTVIADSGVPDSGMKFNVRDNRGAVTDTTSAKDATRRLEEVANNSKNTGTPNTGTPNTGTPKVDPTDIPKGGAPNTGGNPKRFTDQTFNDIYGQGKAWAKKNPRSAAFGGGVAATLAMQGLASPPRGPHIYSPRYY